MTTVNFINLKKLLFEIYLVCQERYTFYFLCNPARILSWADVHCIFGPQISRFWDLFLSKEVLAQNMKGALMKETNPVSVSRFTELWDPKKFFLPIK